MSSVHDGSESVTQQPCLNLLLLSDYREDGAQTVLDHIEAIRDFVGHRVFMLPMLGELPESLNLDRFDGIIIHYSLIISSDAYLSPRARQRIRDFSGLKAVFIQDEYRWVNRTCEALRYLKVHLLFTCVPESEIEKVYPHSTLPELVKVNVLTGYVPAALLVRPLMTYEQRPIDVGYRARRLSAYYGELAQEKWIIAERFQHDADYWHLRCDISCEEQDRLYGDRWIQFVSSCKAMLGVESGASVFDFTGEIQRNVEAFERENRKAGFEEIRDRFFRDLDGLIKLNQISPRCFEAAALGTLMILYEGEYSGVLEPGRHYVPLRKDHSNVADVVAILQNKTEWLRITSAAYEEIACSSQWSYRAFGERIGNELMKRASSLGIFGQAVAPYSMEEFDVITCAHRERVKQQNAERAKYNALQWRLVARFAQYGPPFLVKPLRAVWRAYRKHAARA